MTSIITTTMMMMMMMMMTLSMERSKERLEAGKVGK
jgi:hypothetical protein